MAATEQGMLNREKLLGRVTAVFGKHIKIAGAAGEFEAEVRGKMLRNDLRESPVAVGDNIEFTVESNNLALIESVFPRKQVLSRPDVYVKDRRQIIVANLDQLMIITSTTKPHFSAGLVDRLLVNAESQAIKAIVVINKIDLENEAGFAHYAKTWRDCGYPVIFTSAVTQDGLADLTATLKDKTSALAGHSGVGKSSLINEIDPSLDLKIRVISDATGKGVHTTAAVRMFPLKIGGWIADTPGLKVMTIADIDKKDLQLHFPDFRNHIDDCRFSDCIHINEPDCGIKDAVKKGRVAEYRYQSYQRLWHELAGNANAENWAS